MAKAKSAGGTWSDVKAAVTKIHTQELVALVGDLYRFSKGNRAFLRARFAVVANPLEP